MSKVWKGPTLGSAYSFYFMGWSDLPGRIVFNLIETLYLNISEFTETEIAMLTHLIIIVQNYKAPKSIIPVKLHDIPIRISDVKMKKYKLVLQGYFFGLV
jgi:hypothetical protein